MVLQSADKEIIVTIDSPSKGLPETIKQFAGVKFIVNNERVGKAKALNESVKQSSGKVLLFLDADIELLNDRYFLQKIVEKMRYTDVLDIKKKVANKDSFLSKMAYYEYLTFNVSSWLASEHLQKWLNFNGAAFAMKRTTFESMRGFRKVVAEDLDMATRAFLSDQSFAYTKDVEVSNVVHSNWSNWYRQRRRWAIGQALWLKDFYKDLFKKCTRNPQIFLPATVFLCPPLVSFFIAVILPSVWMQDALMMASWVLSTKLNTVLPIFFFSLTTADLLKSLLISMSSFGVTAALYYRFSRKLGFEMKIHELFVYYFFYSVLWGAIIILGNFEVFVLRRKSAPDWKT